MDSSDISVIRIKLEYRIQVIHSCNLKLMFRINWVSLPPIKSVLPLGVEQLLVMNISHEKIPFASNRAL